MTGLDIRKTHFSWYVHELIIIIACFWIKIAKQTVIFFIWPIFSMTNVSFQHVSLHPLWVWSSTSRSISFCFDGLILDERKDLPFPRASPMLDGSEHLVHYLFYSTHHDHHHHKRLFSYHRVSQGLPLIPKVYFVILKYFDV